MDIWVNNVMDVMSQIKIQLFLVMILTLFAWVFIDICAGSCPLADARSRYISYVRSSSCLLGPAELAFVFACAAVLEVVAALSGELDHS